MRKLFNTFLFLIIAINSVSLFAQNDELLGILKQELDYEFNELKDEEHPPYFMAFRAVDSYNVNISCTNGAVINYSITENKLLSPEIRVGQYSFDDTHIDDKSFPNWSDRVQICVLPYENNQTLINYNIWKVTNELYEQVKDEYITKTERVEKSDLNEFDDFSKEPTEIYYEPVAIKEVDKTSAELWKVKLSNYTSVFNNSPEIILVSGSFNYQLTRKYFLSTEGTEIIENQTISVMVFSFVGKSSDDEFIPYTHVYYATSPDGFPDDKEILTDLEALREDIISLCKAKKAEPFTGPAILAPEVTGVFFHEILGHRIEGHRMELSFNSKTFKEKINKEVINTDISVISDPTIAHYEGVELVGHYKYDDQGVKAQKVVNINNGVLENFLMSRKPINGFDKSNGHGRGIIHSKPVSRQSNLFISSNNPKSDQYLRKKLIKECKKQKVEYGYYFKKVAGGYTNTMNFTPDFFNIIPLEVYRIYVDGRPDELVRGVNLIGTPLMDVQVQLIFINQIH